MELDGLPANIGLPGNYLQVKFAQGQTLGDLSEKTVLLIAPSLSTGSATQDTEIFGPIDDEDYVITKAGTGSVGHRMFAAFAGICKTAKVYMVCPTRSAGVAATGTITFTTTPTSDGVAEVTICGVPCSYRYTASDTVTTIAAGVKAAINAQTQLPVTADNSVGVLTITARNLGPDGNTIRYRATTTAGTGTTVSPTASTACASGATAVSYTAALSAILGQNFDYIVPSASDATALGALATQITAQALPATGFRQQVIAATALSASAAATLASGINNARVRVQNLEQSEEESYVLAAKLAAAYYNTEVSDASYNHDGYGLEDGQLLPILAPFDKAIWFTPTELSTQLASGSTPIGVAKNGKTYIVRSITSRCLNGALVDFRVRDSIRVTVPDRFAADLLARLGTAGFRKICADPIGNAPQPAANFATPRRVKTIVESLISLYCGESLGYLDPAKKQTMIDAIQVQINGTVNSTMDIRVPLYTAVLFHVSRTLVAESSPAN